MPVGIYTKKHDEPDSEWAWAITARNRVLGNILLSFLVAETGSKFAFEIREMED